MWANLTFAVMGLTAAFTGFYALVSLRNPVAGMETATHRLDLLPNVMAGRYLAMFLLALGVLWSGDKGIAAYFLAVCTVMGLYDGWVYGSRGLPHGRHTVSGVLAALGLVIVIGAMVWGG